MVELKNPSDFNYSEHIQETMPDLDLPIAIWKGVRSCTQHPISNFVSYSKLKSIL